MSSGDEIKKTTVDLPIEILKGIKLAIVEDPTLSQGKILIAALKNYLNLRTSLGWKESKDKALQEVVLKAQVSDDPEDRLEFPISVDNLLLLHASCHEALKKAGVPIDDRTTK